MSDIKQEQLASIVAIEKEMRYISVLLKQKGREILSDYTITPPQFDALQWLHEFGDMTIGELSNKMYLAHSTMTVLIDRMEKAELVKRVKDEHDRRVVQIHILPLGEKIIQDVIQQRQAYLKQLMEHFEEDEETELLRLLSKLHLLMK